MPAEALLRDAVVVARGQTGVVDALDDGVLGEPPRDRVGVGEMLAHAQREGLDALLQQERVHRRERRAQVVDDAEAQIRLERALSVRLRV